jgi:ABC-type multidrug transport system fused ATPase/permease subunit
MVFDMLTGGAVGKIVSQSAKKQKDLPVAKPIDAMEEFIQLGQESAVKTEETYTLFETNWNMLRKERKEGKQRISLLLRAVWHTYWKEVCKAAVLKLLWGSLLIFSIAFFVFRILSYVRFKSNDKEHTREEASEAYFLCAFFFLNMVLLSISLQQMAFASSVLGHKVKAALITAIYRKLLIREGFESDADPVSLVAKDCSKVAEACVSLQFLWSGIFESIGIFAVLIAFIGVSALPGLGLLFICLPLQYILGMWMAVKKFDLAHISKDRIKLMEEILRGVKLIKIYCWEDKFKASIGALRKNEAAVLFGINTIKSIILALIFTCPPMFCIVIFGTHESFGDLDATIAFTTLTFFNTLRLPFVKLPKSLRDVLDARLALDRIEAFLLERDLAPDDLAAAPPQGSPAAAASGFSIQGADFSYGANAPALLQGVSLSAPRGSLVIVAGPVASGKTTLVRAVLGQITCRAGTRSVAGSLAYVPQVPWTALGTVRENILFGRPWDEALYRRVLWACALEADLALMPDGDLTYIGEKGGNLSGGQKQRIALARAAYSGADVCVLDSPLSAVDMHSCQHIFRHCIRELLLARGATVLLASHQTHLFQHADTLVVMAAGRIAFSGTYEAARARDLFPVAADHAAGNAGHGESPPEAAPPPAAADAGPSKQLVLVAPGGAKPVHVAAAPAAQLSGPSDGENPAARFGGPYRTYVAYIGGGLFSLSILVFIGAQLIRIFSDIWISRWATRQYRGRSEQWYTLIYLAYVVCFFVGVVTRSLFFFFLGQRAAEQAHDRAFNALLRAPMSYFITTPVGSLLVFFAKDLEAIDDVLVDNACMCITYVCILCTTLGVCIGTLPIFGAIVAGLLLVFLYTFYRYALACARIKAEFARASEDVVAHTSETLAGLAVVRAFGAQERFRSAARAFQDRSGATGLAQGGLSLWLSFRLDMVGCLLVLATCLIAILNEGGITAAASGLAVSNSFQILLFFSIMSATMGEIHAGSGAVDRAAQLATVPAEPDAARDAPSAEERALPAAWPDKGAIEFSGVVMPYLPGAPPVLRGVDFALRAGEKVGVVGRTGAGKSSLIVALYRLTEPSDGTIRVDGVDVGRLALATLRRRIAIIPQEPVMFSGTLRTNLDPLGLRPDAELLAAAEACLLGPLLAGSEGGLDMPVDFAGGNFSLGQQQLVCLARAMLNPSKLLLLDEATAALDAETDAAVQRVLRQHFADRAVLTIAHRLDTIIDSDRILVLDAGRVVELAPPAALLADPGSAFSALCRRAGPAQYAALREAAAAAAAAREAGGGHAGLGSDAKAAKAVEVEAAGGVRTPVTASVAEAGPAEVCALFRGAA